MKIIEALKKTKDLSKKIDDLKLKIGLYCADRDCETPIYTDQRKQVSEWVQSCNDILKEILNLKYRIQKTNINTQVSIEINNRTVTHSISEWVIRRRDLVSKQREIYETLTNRNLLDTKYQLTDKSPETFVRVRLYFDPIERDNKLEEYRSEPFLIDATLEIINAVTDLLE